MSSAATSITPPSTAANYSRPAVSNGEIRAPLARTTSPRRRRNSDAARLESLGCAVHECDAVGVDAEQQGEVGPQRGDGIGVALGEDNAPCSASARAYAAVASRHANDDHEDAALSRWMTCGTGAARPRCWGAT